ncbi:hypothetical protein [Candidatus Oleimmundimicrobium sp.]|uniref:hypothetical protein n=1 Tax=Candidatus Oleimmundimicrobium sp. TaxID=3060597 RepID=UPI00271A5F56|nr:hypothetical protein [Candidatus Oleimmundimicrobium sp.]MDO8886314.1 hypothetical protein [Candidatus Oleimmundimicrobium sp.]
MTFGIVGHCLPTERCDAAISYSPSLQAERGNLGLIVFFCGLFSFIFLLVQENEAKEGRPIIFNGSKITVVQSPACLPVGTAELPFVSLRGQTASAYSLNNLFLCLKMIWQLANSRWLMVEGWQIVAC